MSNTLNDSLISDLKKLGDKIIEKYSDEFEKLASQIERRYFE